MGFFRQVSDILLADIDDLLGRCEKPELMLAQLLREMDEKIIETRRSVARSVAGEMVLGQEVDQHRRQASEWVEKAQLAIEKGKDEMARGALERRCEHEDLAGGLEIEWQAARSDSMTQKRLLRALAAKRAETRRKEDTIQARRKNDERSSDLAEATALLPASSSIRARMGRIQEKIEAMEACVAASVDGVGEDGLLEAAYRELDGDRALEQEMEELRRRVRVVAEEPGQP